MLLESRYPISLRKRAIRFETMKTEQRVMKMCKDVQKEILKHHCQHLQDVFLFWVPASVAFSVKCMLHFATSYTVYISRVCLFLIKIRLMKFILRIFSAFRKLLFPGRGLHQDRSSKEHKKHREAGTKKMKKELSE